MSKGKQFLICVELVPSGKKVYVGDMDRLKRGNRGKSKKIQESNK